MLNQRLWLILGFFVVLLLACIAGLFSVVLFIQNVNAGSGGNCSTPGGPSISTADPTATIQAYFDALKNKNYTKACSYFDLKGTIDVDERSQPLSAELLKRLDAKKGILQSSSIIATLHGSGDTVIILVGVKRSDQNQPYELHFSLQREVGGWKIRHVDGL